MKKIVWLVGLSIEQNILDFRVFIETALTGMILKEGFMVIFHAGESC